jgi:hypothetical protein
MNKIKDKIKEIKTPRDWHKNSKIKNKAMFIMDIILKYLCVKLNIAKGNNIHINSPKKIGFPKKEKGLFISKKIY